MTERLDLDAIEARANAATPGPWSSDGDSLATYEPGDVSIWGYLDPELRRGIVFNVGSIITEVGYACEREREDADFIAAAREDVPALCAALRASRAEVERLRDVLERIAGGPVQSALCTSPTRKMEHLSTMCPHCRARAALKNEQFRGGAVAAQPGEVG